MHFGMRLSPIGVCFTCGISPESSTKINDLFAQRIRYEIVDDVVEKENRRYITLMCLLGNTAGYKTQGNLKLMEPVSTTLGSWRLKTNNEKTPISTHKQTVRGFHFHPRTKDVIWIKYPSSIQRYYWHLAQTARRYCFNWIESWQIEIYVKVYKTRQ